MALWLHGLHGSMAYGFMDMVLYLISSSSNASLHDNGSIYMGRSGGKVKHISPFVIEKIRVITSTNGGCLHLHRRLCTGLLLILPPHHKLQTI
jgi:hypothetical protein